ncbi:hypothetical protein ANRL2_01387 [Anaerolineae bacterium]|nr:hypothetical protein ANRL2_01387 [Anaerolineae bacterium]
MELQEGPICHCTRMGRRQMRRFLAEKSGAAKVEKELPSLLDFQRATGAGRRCTGCALDLARAFDIERKRRAAEISEQPLLWSEF